MDPKPLLCLSFFLSFSFEVRLAKMAPFKGTAKLHESVPGALDVVKKS